MTYPEALLLTLARQIQGDNSPESRTSERVSHEVAPSVRRAWFEEEVGRVYRSARGALHHGESRGGPERRDGHTGSDPKTLPFTSWPKQGWS